MLKKIIAAAFVILTAVIISGCGSEKQGDYYYVSNGVELTESEAEDYKRAFELSSSRLQEALNAPLDESAYTSYQKELEDEPFPEARVWSADIRDASNSIEDRSTDISERRAVLDKGFDDNSDN